MLGATAPKGESEEGVPAPFLRNVSAYRHRLEWLRDEWARVLTGRLSGQLRQAIVVKPVAMRYVSFARFRARQGHPPLWELVAVEGMPGGARLGMLELDCGLAITLIDRLLGGPGTFPSELRPVTSLESHLLEKMWEGWLSALTDLISPFAELRLTGTGVSVAAAAALDVPDDVMMEWEYRVCHPHAQGFLRIALPDPTQWPWRKQAGNRPSGDPKAAASAFLASGEVTVPVTAVLGRADLTAKDVLGLEKGDIIRLDTPGQGRVELVIGGRGCLLARPVIRRGRLAVKVLPAGEAEGERDAQG